MPHKTRKQKVKTTVPTGDTHTLEGIVKMQAVLTTSLTLRYNSLRYSMFTWTDSTGKCDKMFTMSCTRAPEEVIINNDFAAFFDFEDSTYCLPIIRTDEGQPNIYGNPRKWKIQTYNNFLIDKEINSKILNYDNSVLCTNGPIPTIQEYSYIEMMVKRMVDVLTTIFHRTLLARAPYVFAVRGMQDSRATNYMNALINFSPYIIQAENGIEPVKPLQTVAIDTGLLDIISLFDAQILGYIGYDATDVYKRAQQSISETQMSQTKISMYRQSKYRIREYVCSQYNKKFGNDLHVISNLDEYGQPEIPTIAEALNLEDKNEIYTQS